MSDSPSRVLFVSSESRPFASTGGLADVAGALPVELNREGIPVDRIMPLYRQVWDRMERHGYSLERTGFTLRIPLGNDQINAEIYSTEFEGARTYFVNHEEYFDRQELYALPHREYRDNFIRFLFFQKAVVALIDAMGQPYDLLHLNDWQTGLIPLFLEKGIYGTGREGREKTVFTIHNLAYQGTYPAVHLYETNLPANLLANYPELEFYGQLNQMKAGLMGADQVNTVSPNYAREILTEEFGCGLEGVLQSLKNPVTGIVNGVDTNDWNPETDPTLPAQYSAKAFTGKETCKKELLKEFGLGYEKEKPLLVMVSRMVEQKGFDLLGQAVEALMSLPLQMVVLGSGQEQYQSEALSWAERWPEQFAVRIGYDSDLSHRMEAGGDFFLMPSRFEPCGLNQLYSLRYGTVPIVNRTGGLEDTVEDIRQDPDHGTGFLMSTYTPEALIDCVREGLSLFHHKPELRKVRQRGMGQDVSWKKTAADYLDLYRTLFA